MTAPLADPQAFAAAWTADRHRLRAWIATRCPADDVDDVLSDVAVRAFRARGTFTGDRPGPWLQAVARSAVVDAWRARQRRPLALVDDGEHPVEPIEQRPEGRPADVAEARALVHELLDRVTDRQREALTLVYLHDVEHSAAARRLGIPLGTLKSRTRDGRLVAAAALAGAA